jgi:hypothetical protein
VATILRLECGTYEPAFTATGSAAVTSPTIAGLTFNPESIFP